MVFLVTLWFGKIIEIILPKWGYWFTRWTYFAKLALQFYCWGCRFLFSRFPFISSWFYCEPFWNFQKLSALLLHWPFLEIQFHSSNFGRTLIFTLHPLNFLNREFTDLFLEKPNVLKTRYAIELILTKSVV